MLVNGEKCILLGSKRTPSVGVLKSPGISQFASYHQAIPPLSLCIVAPLNQPFAFPRSKAQGCLSARAQVEGSVCLPRPRSGPGPVGRD